VARWIDDAFVDPRRIVSLLVINGVVLELEKTPLAACLLVFAAAVSGRQALSPGIEESSLAVRSSDAED